MKPILPEARICMLTLGTKLLYWMFSEEKNDSIKTESNYQAMIIKLEKLCYPSDQKKYLQTISTYQLKQQIDTVDKLYEILTVMSQSTHKMLVNRLGKDHINDLTGMEFSFSDTNDLLLKFDIIRKLPKNTPTLDMRIVSEFISVYNKVPSNQCELCPHDSIPKRMWLTGLLKDLHSVNLVTVSNLNKLITSIQQYKLLDISNLIEKFHRVDFLNQDTLDFSLENADQATNIHNIWSHYQHQYDLKHNLYGDFNFKGTEEEYKKVCQEAREHTKFLLEIIVRKKEHLELISQDKQLQSIEYIFNKEKWRNYVETHYPDKPVDYHVRSYKI